MKPSYTTFLKVFGCLFLFIGATRPHAIFAQENLSVLDQRAGLTSQARLSHSGMNPYSLMRVEEPDTSEKRPRGYASIKVNVLGAALGEYSASVEGFINDRFSVGITGGAISLYWAQGLYDFAYGAFIEDELDPADRPTVENVEVSLNGAMFGIEGRYYWPKNLTRPNGGYVGPYFMWQNPTFEVTVPNVTADDSLVVGRNQYTGHLEVEMPAAAFGVQLGRQWLAPIGKRGGFVFDLNFRIGLTLVDIDTDPRIIWTGPFETTQNPEKIGLPTDFDSDNLFDYEDLYDDKGVSRTDNPEDTDGNGTHDDVDDVRETIDGFSTMPFIGFKFHIGYNF